MFLIMKGKVAISKSDQVLGMLSEGSFFGEMAILTRSRENIRKRSATAASTCDLCFLGRETIAVLCLDCPELRENIERFAKSRMRRGMWKDEESEKKKLEAKKQEEQAAAAEVEHKEQAKRDRHDRRQLARTGTMHSSGLQSPSQRGSFRGTVTVPVRAVSFSGGEASSTVKARSSPGPAPSVSPGERASSDLTSRGSADRFSRVTSAPNSGALWLSFAHLLLRVFLLSGSCSVGRHIADQEDWHQLLARQRLVCC